MKPLQSYILFFGENEYGGKIMAELPKIQFYIMFIPIRKAVSAISVEL